MNTRFSKHVWGFPVVTPHPDERSSAVWMCDEITAHFRVGSHWLCTVRYSTYGQMLAWIPKKYLRVSVPERLMWAQ